MKYEKKNFENYLYYLKIICEQDSIYVYIKFLLNSKHFVSFIIEKRIFVQLITSTLNRDLLLAL